MRHDSHPRGLTFSAIVLVLALSATLIHGCSGGGGQSSSGQSPQIGSAGASSAVMPSGTSGTMMAITGTGFTPTSQVMFGNIKADVVAYLSPTQVVAIVPFTISNGALIPLAAGSYPISVDGGAPQAFTVTALPKNPNPPGTILNAALPVLVRAYTANRSAIQVTLTTLQSQTTDPALVSFATRLLSLLPDLDAYVQNELPHLTTTLDPTSLALTEQALLAELGFPLPSVTITSVSAPLAAAGVPILCSTTTPGDCFLEERKQNELTLAHKIASKTLGVFMSYSCITAAAGGPTAPLFIPACVAAVVLTLIDAFEEMENAKEVGELNDFLLTADKGTTSSGKTLDVPLVLRESTQLSASILVQKTLKGATFLEVVLKSVGDVLDRGATGGLAGIVWELIKGETVDQLIKWIPGIPSSPAEKLRISFSYVEWSQRGTTSSIPLKAEDIVSITNDGDTGLAAGMTEAASVTWRFNINNKFREWFEMFRYRDVRFTVGDLVTHEGTVFGTSTDEPIKGAVVSTSLDSATTLTDASGHFFLVTKTPIVPGVHCCINFTVTITAPGFPTYNGTNIWGGHGSSIVILAPPDPIPTPGS